MSEVARSELDAKRAIRLAFDNFSEFFEFSPNKPKNVLLEGVEYNADIDEWDISIGFDIGRERTTSPQLSFLQSTREPLREVRVITLRGADGAFVRMR